MSSVQVATGTLVKGTAVIPLNGTLSNVIQTKGLSLVGISLPASLTGTALKFQACDTVDGTFLPVYNSAGEISLTVAASRYIAVDPKDFQGIQFLKLVSGTTEIAERTIGISLKGI